MSEWQRCYEEPRAFSWRENIDGEIIVVRADNHVERLPRDEFYRRYTLRRPAPAEYRDDLRKAASEIECLRDALADSVALIEGLIDTRRCGVADLRRLNAARTALEAKP
jgi:hypothetical protein